MKNKNAIGYIRSAVEDQTGEALAKQIQEITTFCGKKGLQLIKIFQDNGASGLDFNRKGWNELKDYLKNNKDAIQSLVVSGLDRIGRDALKCPEEIAHVEDKFGIKILSVEGQRIFKELKKIFKRRTLKSKGKKRP